MSDRWYHQPGNNTDVITVSRIRLLRNFRDYLFPSAMSPEERNRLFKAVDTKLKDLPGIVGSSLEKASSEQIEEETRLAFKERMLINKATLESGAPFMLYASQDESFSMTVNGTDHLRLLLSCHGQDLKELLEKMGRIDSYIAGKIPYAYDRRLGFKTSTLQNVGTGMRAYYVMHLPLLSEVKGFAMLQQEMGRYGVVIKEAWGLSDEEIGGLYVLYNQRTLGMKEEDIVDILTSVAGRLISQERDLRNSQSSLSLRDRVFRSYGILSYAARLELPEACRMLSDIMLGVSMGLLKTESDVDCYELMLGVFPGNLQVYYGKHFGGEEMKIRRAEYIKKFLKQVIPVQS